MTGYGTGTGPPGLGVLQTSGIVHCTIPLLPLWTRELLWPFTLIETLTPDSFHCLSKESRRPSTVLRTSPNEGPRFWCITLQFACRPEIHKQWTGSSSNVSPTIRRRLHVGCVHKSF